MSETLSPAVEVSFHGHPLVTVEVGDTQFVAMRPLVEAIGLAWPAQYQKLSDRPEKYGVSMIGTPSAGGPQNTLCIPLRKLNGWLFSIDADRVSPDLRDKVVMYQEECFEVLHDYWAGKRRQYSPDLQNRLWYQCQPVLTTQQLAAALRATVGQLEGRRRHQPLYFRAGTEFYIVPQGEIHDLREQAAAVFACPISPFCSNLTVWTRSGARAAAMVLGGKGKMALYAQLERTYYADASARHKPGASIADALITAERMLCELKEQTQNLGRIRGLLTS